MAKFITLLTQVNVCYVNKILKIVPFYLKPGGQAKCEEVRRGGGLLEM